MKKYAALFSLVVAFSFSEGFSQFTTYVKPMVGTGGHGHTYPGATLPFALVQLSPDTRIDGSWDGCGGYYYADSLVYGFSHTHLSGTGCSDYGDVMLMPVTKKKQAYTPADYAAPFQHEDEKASPGYYSTVLKGTNVTADFTTTLRTGFHRYVFHDTDQAMIVMDLNHRDMLLDGEINILNDHTISGYRYSKAWAENQKIFFYIEFSKKIKRTSVLNDGKTADNFITAKGKKICANLFFDLKPNDTLLVKVGISGTGVEGAKLNLQTENPGWNFQQVHEQAVVAWEKELGKIEVICDTKTEYEVFYTALYHTLIVPNTWNDVDGKYRGRDDQVHTGNGNNFYTVFSLWDTFRAAHPLYTLTQQDRTRDFVSTFLLQYEQGGRLPVWELSANETDCMIGVHSISVIADAISKGLVNETHKTGLLNAIKDLYDDNYRGLDIMKVQDHLTIEDESESVSKTLEYCYQYFCMSVIAHWAGDENFASELEWKSLGYKNLFDTDTGFFAPRANGGFIPGFDPRQVNNHYTEANGWQYTFFVPHDIKGMIELYGGKEKFHARLDSIFGTTSKMTGREQADITGLIGQYAHGNEPSHHVVYLYKYIGDDKKTHDLVSYICKNFYSPAEDGLSGNEDCGQMSAWYVLSALGLYQVNPGSPYFTITNPQVQSAIIHLDNGKKIEIKRDAGEIKHITWNNTYYHKNYISYRDLTGGGRLLFLSTDPELTGDLAYTGPDLLATSSIKKSSLYVPAPVIKTTAPVFEKETTVFIDNPYNNLPVYYSCIGSSPKDYSATQQLYKGPFTIKSSSVIEARVVDTIHHIESPIVVTELHKYPNNYLIDITSIPHVQYMSNGKRSLMDGVYGSIDWRKGNWLGYDGQDFTATIDTRKPVKINSITCDFLEDTRAWIYYPTEVEISFSKDGVTYTPVQTLPLPDKNKTSDQLGTYKLSFDMKGKKYRYIKIVAKNFGKLPAYHPGAGSNAYIFIDEIEFN